MDVGSPGGGESGEMILAVDIGGTKVEVGLVSCAGEIVLSRRASTDRSDPWSVVAELVTKVVGEAGAGAGADAPGAGSRGGPVVVGVGCGGPMTFGPDGGEAVSPLNIPAWRGFPLRRRLHELTGLPVYVDNDAKALALAEGWVGAAATSRNFVALVVSTGVGAGIVLDGRLLDGEAGNCGHLGHVVVVDGGRSCECGGRGCLEAEASGTAIEAITGAPAAVADRSMRERTGTLVGRAIAQAAVLLDLRLAVVAGSVALGFGEPFFAAAQREVDRLARIEYVRAGVAVRRAGLGDRGPLVGAAAVGRRGGVANHRDGHR